MSWASKWIASAALAVGMIAAPSVSAQPDRKGADRDKKGKLENDKKDRKDADKKERPSRLELKPAKPDPAVEAWVKSLTEKMNDPHDSIRESARAAIIHIGRPAMPELRKLAEGDDGAKSEAARKLLKAIEHRHGHHGHGGPAAHGRHGFGGQFGFGGAGGHGGFGHFGFGGAGGHGGFGFGGHGGNFGFGGQWGMPGGKGGFGGQWGMPGGKGFGPQGEKGDKQPGKPGEKSGK